jgi:hypothetical protein
MTDRRVPKRRDTTLQRYACETPGCDQERDALMVPLCPRHGTRMVPVGLIEARDRFADDVAARRTRGAPSAGRWDGRLNPVEVVLARWIVDVASIEQVAERAGLSLGRIRRGGTPINAWHAVLIRAAAEGKVEAVLTHALEVEPSVELRRAIDAWRDDE